MKYSYEKHTCKNPHVKHMWFTCEIGTISCDSHMIHMWIHMGFTCGFLHVFQFTCESHVIVPIPHVSPTCETHVYFFIRVKFKVSTKKAPNGKIRRQMQTKNNRKHHWHILSAKCSYLYWTVVLIYFLHLLLNGALLCGAMVRCEEHNGNAFAIPNIYCIIIRKIRCQI